MKFAKKIHERQIIQKIAHENRNQHTTISPCIKFQSIWRTLDFETKFTQNYMTNFEKINIKIVISMLQCTPVSNFSQFGKLQILELNLSKKNE